MDKQMQNRWLSLVIAVTFITAMLVFGFLAEPPRSEAALGESAPALNIQFTWKAIEVAPNGAERQPRDSDRVALIGQVP